MGIQSRGKKATSKAAVTPKDPSEAALARAKAEGRIEIRKRWSLLREIEDEVQYQRDHDDANYSPDMTQADMIGLIQKVLQDQAPKYYRGAMIEVASLALAALEAYDTKHVGC